MKRAWWVAALVLVTTACGPHQSVPATSATATETDAGPQQAPRAECQLVESGCHSVDECHGRGVCEPAPPSSDYGCGIPPTRVESCKADADCKPTEVCKAFAFGCEVGHRCEPRCDSAGCQDGWLCRADGRCTAAACPDEWSCTDYGVCKPPAPDEGLLQGGRDWHGCMPSSCARDADCPCAHCVNSRCSPIPGRCIEPRG